MKHCFTIRAGAIPGPSSAGRKPVKRSKPPRKVRLAELEKQSDWLEKEMIRRRVAAPIERRMNFLRKRVGICSSCL